MNTNVLQITIKITKSNKNYCKMQYEKLYIFQYQIFM